MTKIERLILLRVANPDACIEMLRALAELLAEHRATEQLVTAAEAYWRERDRRFLPNVRARADTAARLRAETVRVRAFLRAREEPRTSDPLSTRNY